MERQTNNLSEDKEKEWKNIVIEGSEYLISTYVGKNSWKVSMSDLVEIWTETITRETALSRCQSLNALLDLETFKVKETLDAILNDVGKYATKKTLKEIKLEKCIEGVPFKFAVELTKGNRQNFWNDITKPLCRSSIELQRRNEILLDLIKKKDEEISEYKLSGARLSRKKAETLPYDDEIFQDGVLSIGKGESRECLSAFQSVMQLYHELKKFESLSIGSEFGCSTKLNAVKTEIKSEIEDPEEAAAIEDVDRSSDMETGSTTVDTSVVKRETKDKKTLTNNDSCKTESGIDKGNSKKRSCVDQIVANVPSSSMEQQVKHKKLKQKSDIYKIIR